MDVSSKEDGGSENPLKCSDQPTVLGAALLHPEGVEHFRGAVERDPAGPLPVCQGCEEQRHEAILPPGEAVVGVPSDEEHELAVATFVDQSSGRRAFNWQPTEDERSGGKSDILARRLSSHSHTLDRLGFSDPTFPNRSYQTNTV
jgi:hypothetical protein